MLDVLLGRGFSSKCKSSIKLTRARIDVLRRRKEATQRFLKSNLAQLLANGLDINAYGREVKQTEEFLAGLNLLSCYDFIEQSCEYILKQVSVMQKQSECPEDCREAVGSLMFAAARFSDLPELRDLRDTFQERYGSSLEHFVNPEFVEKLALRPPTMEKKLQFLQSIALELSIKWDSRAFEQRMANPSAFAKEAPKEYGPVLDHVDKFKLPIGKETITKMEKRNHSYQERTELTNDKHRLRNGGEDSLLKRDELDHQIFSREELTGHREKPLMGREQCIPKRDNDNVPFQGRREFTDGKHESLHGKEDTALKSIRPNRSNFGKGPEFFDSGYEIHNDRMNSIPNRDGHGHLSDGKSEVAARVMGVPSRRNGKDVLSVGYSDYSQPGTANSTSKVKDEETDRLKSYSRNAILPPPYVKSKGKPVPPPYIKSKDGKYGVNTEANHASADSDGTSMDSLMRKSNNVVQRSERNQGESDYPNYDDRVVGPAQVSSHGFQKDVAYRDNIPLPKPRSIRRKHSKSLSNRDDFGNIEDSGVAKRSSSSKRRDNSRKGLQILFDDEHHQKDEEERRIDRLLLHYSKKPSSTYEPEKVRRKSKAQAHASHQIATDGSDGQAEMVPHPTRSVSLPSEQPTPTETVKVFTRANSFQPDKPAQHVHPKLPDYDDLAARFAAMKGQ
ncbi:hypothetical protein CsSME_00051106 [Camellia sinensis var. sinensis]